MSKLRALGLELADVEAAGGRELGAEAELGAAVRELGGDLEGEGEGVGAGDEADLNGAEARLVGEEHRADPRDEHLGAGGEAVHDVGEVDEAEPGGAQRLAEPGVEQGLEVRADGGVRVTCGAAAGEATEEAAAVGDRV